MECVVGPHTQNTAGDAQRLEVVEPLPANVGLAGPHVLEQRGPDVGIWIDA